MAFPFLIQGANVVVVIGNTSHTISKTHITYDKVVAAIKAGDWELVKDVIEPKKVVLSYGRGNVTIEGETLLWKGKELNTGLATRMIQMLQEGFPIEPMVNFMENLMSNPSKRSVQELYGFLEKSNLPITPDGHFLAYKKVRADYKDVHSGTFDNSVGQVCKMERNEVDDDKDRTCSTGLHFCSMSYLSCFGGERVMILKIDPSKVVSIPSDYNDAKGRTCEYEVIGELNVDPDKAFTESVQETAVGSQPIFKKKVLATKTGTSDFYRGYTDGFTGADYADIDTLAYHDGYVKGDDAELEQYRYVGVVAAKKVVEPKKGSTPFYRGYTDGFRNNEYNTSFSNWTDQRNYEEGFDKGQQADLLDEDAQYEYTQYTDVVPKMVTVTLTPGQAWPFPTKG